LISLITIIGTKVLPTIKEKEFVQYPFFIKSGVNTWNSNKFFFFLIVTMGITLKMSRPKKKIIA